MCKMLFIGTNIQFLEHPLDTKAPGFNVEKISGEFLAVKSVFQNPYVYFVGTSHGCSCDFGIQITTEENLKINHSSPFQNFQNKFRKLTGTYEEWQKKHTEKMSKLIEQDQNYKTQTFELIDIITKGVNNGNSVELYCTWAGDYSAKPEAFQTIELSKTDIKKSFEIEEKFFVTFTK